MADSTENQSVSGAHRNPRPPNPDEIATIYDASKNKITGFLVRKFGSFELAEDALQEAFAAAITQWPDSGTPKDPVAWLVRIAQNKAIDALRKQKRLSPSDSNDLELYLGPESDRFCRADHEPRLDFLGDDEVLPLVFACCNPALAIEAQVALTLREVCGLTTEEIARAFLTSTPTIAQRIVRAKAKIRDAKIPLEIPDSTELPVRLRPVLQVIYLVFNEGYTASEGTELVRRDFVFEAIRLGEILHARFHEDADSAPEIAGLLALMLLHAARTRARYDANGDLVLLENQDRSLWDQEMIRRAELLIQTSLTSQGTLARPAFGKYTLQAAISAVSIQAKTYADTDWPQIVGLYSQLLRLDQSPVVALNRAVAVSMASGPHAALPEVELLIGGPLKDYHHAYIVRGHLYSRLGNKAAAVQDFERAMKLTKLEPERRQIRKEIAKNSPESVER